jgi:uncharacterized membrane protein YqjE
MEQPSHVSNLATLVGEAFSQMAKVLQTEVALAKAELAAEVGKASTNIGLLVGGALFLMPALVLLLFALAAALIANNFSPATAYLSAGVLGLVIAFALIAIGVARMKAMTFLPERTVRQLNKDRQALNEVTR